MLRKAGGRQTSHQVAFGRRLTQQLRCCPVWLSRACSLRAATNAWVSARRLTAHPLCLQTPCSTLMRPHLPGRPAHRRRAAALPFLQHLHRAHPQLRGKASGTLDTAAAADCRPLGQRCRRSTCGAASLVKVLYSPAFAWLMFDSLLRQLPTRRFAPSSLTLRSMRRQSRPPSWRAQSCCSSMTGRKTRLRLRSEAGRQYITPARQTHCSGCGSWGCQLWTFELGQRRPLTCDLPRLQSFRLMYFSAAPKRLAVLHTLSALN